MTSVKHRKYTSRTRSGCRTCKIRRVKCDEQRPSCVKCIGSGRVCNGYGIWDRPAEVLSKPRLQTTSVFYPPQSFPGLDQQEKRHLHRFRYFVAGRLAEPFGSHFWSSLVLQISLSEPAVVHASIALSSAYDLFLPDIGYNTSSPVSNISFLLRQYNRAIRALTSKINLNDSASLRTAAVSSILFICLEILRGDSNAMYAHFGSGVKLLSQLQNRRGGSPASSELVLVEDDPQIYDDHLVTVFSQLNLQFLMLGNSSQLRETFITPFYYSRRVHIPPQFRNVVEARRSFTSILLAVTYLCKEFERAILTSNSQIPEPCITEIEKQQALEAAMTEWVASYERSITSFLASASHGEAISLTMLRIYARTCTIIIGTCLTIKETAYDPYLCEFESILKQYRDSLSPGACKLDPCFTIDMGLFPPLYFTAIKCRNHSVRKQALSLLEQYPTMEGPWTGPMLARVGGYVVDLEEKHFLKALQSPPVAPVSIPTTSADAVQLHNSVAAPGVVLPEFCRIHCVECKLPSRYSNAPNAALLKLSRFKHELGKSGGWCVINAKVGLSGVQR
ncbi:hypothetical protein BDV39DRAFT_215835 [Aspergillus sergii]|uniref:Zn(2)-C6 fungal-type domain-containing protein n=1 Tax=Aspergillus sergii TaxID=1034303 RepID=A0A5N6XHQ4_9EURO|nr:hypothetical protein BDV39DRAFT_215835 [Aspergillus sergii]